MSKSNNFELVELIRKDKPDVRFVGRLIASADSRRPNVPSPREGSRWTECEVYETPAGKWVAVAIACSDRPGERDHTDTARLIEQDAPAVMQRAVMEAFGWSWVAKKLASAAGWDVVEVLE